MGRAGGDKTDESIVDCLMKKVDIFSAGGFLAIAYFHISPCTWIVSSLENMLPNQRKYLNHTSWIAFNEAF